jgi:glycosyltransferase involved in cell wall biosynthesis
MNHVAPSVSVVIPAYNASATIAEAVTSARFQTLRPAEIIVVDDGSTDDTVERVEALIGPDLKLIRHTTNRGGAAARNRGVDAASGDLVAFLDADDLWSLDKLELQRETLREAGANTYCFTAVRQTNEYGEAWVLPRRGPKPDEPMADFMLKAGNIVQTSTLLVPRSLCRSHRFSERLRRFQDIDFVLQLEWAGARAVYLDQPLVHWRNFAAGSRVSALQDPALLADFLEVHGAHLAPAQRLGLEVRSLVPLAGARAKLQWVRTVGRSVALGALAPLNALSLLAKHGLGADRYAQLRHWVPR